MCTANTLSAMSSALGKCFASYVVVWKTLGFCLFVPKGKTFFFSFPTFSAYCKLTKAQAATDLAKEGSVGSLLLHHRRSAGNLMRFATKIREIPKKFPI